LRQNKKVERLLRGCGTGWGKKEKIRQCDTKNIEEENEKEDTRCREQKKARILI
jgi:hypothetical protein